MMIKEDGGEEREWVWKKGKRWAL